MTYLSWGHHHTPPNSVDGVWHEASSDSNDPAKNEGKENWSVVSQNDGLDGVVEAEVHASVDEDTHAGDDEATVQTLDTVGLDGLDVHVNHAIVLPGASLGLGVVSQPVNNKVKSVENQMRIGQPSYEGWTWAYVNG